MNRDTLAINTIKINGIAAINKANSGHPGIVLGAAPIIHTLYSKHLNFDPKHPSWINRDRFILSAGHGSALLYAQLRLLNLISEKDLKDFRQLNSKTPGHPEFGHTKGVEATTGPLGQGLAMAVGTALAERSLRARFSEINHFTYVLCGDGDIEEGIAQEALSFAGYQKLNKLIVLHDSNKIQLDTRVDKVFNENLKKRMESLGFKYIYVKDSTVEAIDKAISVAKKSTKPTYIEINTIIGKDATNENTPKVHGAPLGDDIKNVIKKLNWKYKQFEVPKEVKTLYEKTIFARGKKLHDKFKTSKELKEFLDRSPEKIKLNIDKNLATRASSGKVVEYLNDTYDNWMGGSADLSGSTKAKGGDGEVSSKNPKGRNVLFGVREFAMGAIANGMALHSNFWPFVSTFFVFSDYIKPAIRLSSLMNLKVTYIFTHDSVFVGEDGPTHEPIEQLAMLRSVPNLNVVRPADENEVKGAYDLALTSSKPTVIALTRQNVESLKETSQSKVKKGNYHLNKTKSKWTLVASGSELANALNIAKELKINCVSISNSDGKVTWDTNYAITIEAGTTYGLAKWGKYNLGIDTFGYSAPGKLVYEKFGLDLTSLRRKIKNIIKNK